MRRILLLAVGVLALAFAVPAAASAHGHGRHHGHHRHARAHHARLEHFGGDASSSDPGTTGPTDAGTVASFTGGVLTLTLADGSTVSGKVTSDTEINCMGSPTAAASRDGSSGEDQGDQSGGDPGDQADWGDQGDQQQPQSSCDTTDLVAGAPVHEAILKIGSGGAEFKMVLLDQQQGS
jgi:hypothetical protein